MFCSSVRPLRCPAKGSGCGNLLRILLCLARGVAPAFGAVAAFGAMGALPVAAAESFDWSWEKAPPSNSAPDRPAEAVSDPKPTATVLAPVAPASAAGQVSSAGIPPGASRSSGPAGSDAPPRPAAPAPVEPFRWSWESKAGARPAAAMPREQATPAQPAGEAGAYGELLKENLELRRKVADAQREREKREAENRRLLEEIKDLDARITESSKLVQDLRKQRDDVTGEAGKAADLQARLAKAEEQKLQLQRDLVDLQARLETNRPAVVVVESAPSAGVQPDSDLFRSLQEENVRLKGRLVAMEKEQAERERVAKAARRADVKAEDVKLRERQLRSELDLTRDRERASRQTVEQLLQQIPVLERKLGELEVAQSARESSLAEKEREVDTLKEELRRREHRLAKAERMATMIDSAREQVRQVSDREKRDMHYNMAAVYAREGRARDAEREYLMALEVDPADANTHFNLAILYDDELKDRRRAAMHYRRYLKLAPHSPDADRVKEWLLRID